MRRLSDDRELHGPHCIRKDLFLLNEVMNVRKNGARNTTRGLRVFMERLQDFDNRDWMLIDSPSIVVRRRGDQGVTVEFGRPAG